MSHNIVLQKKFTMTIRSLEKLLNSLCWDDSYTIAQWLEHRCPQVKVSGLSPGRDSHFFFRLFFFFPFPQLLVVNTIPAVN